MSDGPFWSEIGLIMQKLSEADRVTLIQHQRKSEDSVRAEAQDMGRRMEREAVVAWLRAEAVSHEATWGGRTVDFLETTASEVERGEHEKGSGE